MTTDWTALYILQDAVLTVLKTVDHGFYLTGGTALGRGYYGHRYSEDLDFFVNDRPMFELWRDRCLNALNKAAVARGWRLEIVLREARFGRAVVHAVVPLKLEFINDVPCRIGEPVEHPQLGRLDTRENILANKITALVDRAAPKDAADIFWLCCRDGLDIVRAIEDSSGKAAGVFPPLVARALTAAVKAGVPDVAWIDRPADEAFSVGMTQLIERVMDVKRTDNGRIVI